MSYGYKTNLILGNSVHEAAALSYAFDKNIDENGDVTSFVEGGTIFLSMSDIPADTILEWGMSHRLLKSGLIQTIGIDGDGSSIVAEEVEFEMAACQNLKIIYEREHPNYFTTLLTISPKNICIGRNNCWINKNWTIEETPKQQQSTISISDILPPKDAAIDGYLYIMGKKYEIQSFETEFIQPDDYKGQPQHEVKGGLLLVTLKQQSDEILNNWMFKNGVSYSGSIVFAPVSRIENPPLTILFEEGSCISFEKMLGKNIGIQLSILISSEKVLFNAVKHTNKFVRAN
jgi:hypothetical protein